MLNGVEVCDPGYTVEQQAEYGLRSPAGSAANNLYKRRKNAANIPYICRI